MIPFYVKIKIEYSQGKQRVFIIARRIFGENLKDARQYTEALIPTFRDVQSFEILEISEYPIFIQEFLIEGIIKYYSSTTKAFHYVVKAEDRTEAESLFKLISNTWKGIKQIDITQISKFYNQNFETIISNEN
jgi:hypothetical protein